MPGASAADLTGQVTEAGVRCWGADHAGRSAVPVAASGGTPAFAQYRDGGDAPWAIILLELDDTHIKGMTSYLDVETLFPRFGLPAKWPR